jgi:hypothetical protein
LAQQSHIEAFLQYIKESFSEPTATITHGHVAVDHRYDVIVSEGGVEMIVSVSDEFLSQRHPSDIRASLERWGVAQKAREARGAGRLLITPDGVSAVKR